MCRDSETNGTDGSKQSSQVCFKRPSSLLHARQHPEPQSFFSRRVYEGPADCSNP